VHGDLSSAAIFRGVISQLNGATYTTIRIEDHLPSQVCNFGGPQSGLRRQQDDDLVSNWMPGTLSVDEEIFYIVVGYRFGLLAGHVLLRDQIFN
jgi:hypothetical protein